MWKRYYYSASLLLACTNISKAEVSVKVTWDYVFTEYSPISRVGRSQSTSGFTLNGKTISFKSAAGRYQSSGSLGDTLESINLKGVHYLTSYNYKNNLITETNRFPGFTDIVSIKTNGADSCEATVTYRRLRGKKYFLDSIDSTEFSDMHAENVTCRIQKPSQ